MEFNSSRRKFMKTGILLPAAGIASAPSLSSFAKTPSSAAYRMLVKTGLKISTMEMATVNG